jgi:hypothetical protein
MKGGWAPLTGLVFVALAVVSFIVGGDTPDVDESGAEVISFYDENSGEQQAAGGLLLWAAVFFLFFAGVLRRVLRSAEQAPGWLSAVAFGGAVVATVGVALFATLAFALTDDPEALDPAAAQALNVLSVDAFGPVAVGVSAFLIASGLAIVRTGALAGWLGWVAIVFGVVAVTPIGFAAFFAFLAWTLVVSLMLALAPGAAPPRPGGMGETAG